MEDAGLRANRQQLVPERLRQRDLGEAPLGGDVVLGHHADHRVDAVQAVVEHLLPAVTDSDPVLGMPVEEHRVVLLVAQEARDGLDHLPVLAAVAHEHRRHRDQ